MSRAEKIEKLGKLSPLNDSYYEPRITVVSFQLVCGCGKPGCRRCRRDPSPAACGLNCKLCTCDPDVVLPMLYGQRDQLRKVLKDLWKPIDLFMDIYCLDQEEDVKSGEWQIIRDQLPPIQILIRSCPFTRAYLDSEKGAGWSEKLFDILSTVVVRSFCCRLPKLLYCPCPWCNPTKQKGDRLFLYCTGHIHSHISSMSSIHLLGRMT